MQCKNAVWSSFVRKYRQTLWRFIKSSILSFFVTGSSLFLSSLFALLNGDRHWESWTCKVSHHGTNPYKSELIKGCELSGCSMRTCKLWCSASCTVERDRVKRFFTVDIVRRVRLNGRNCRRTLANPANSGRGVRPSSRSRLQAIKTFSSLISKNKISLI